MTPADAEAKRILDEYRRRDAEIGADFYALTRSPNLFARHSQQRALLRALDRAGMLPLRERRVLDVGCGRGQWIALFEDLGARRDLIAGTDLNPERVETARARFQGADLRVGDATQLPWPVASFDLVLQATMFTSILDDRVRAAIAAEMRRVLAPGGVIVWYDFRYNNPRNANVRGITAGQIERLFPKCSVELESVTLAPPLARRLVPRTWLLASALERLRVLNTHYLGVIRDT